ncbi:MAG: response regulator [Anaerolineales bacterium]|jgi:diguanylate cyclase (GGDEF)-like protein|nr:response regulator [Anaerolineales bacterium]
METELPAILIIDEPASVELLKIFLAGENYRVHGCSTAQGILMNALDVLPDLVLINFDLPGLDGFELCRQLRNKTQLANIPTIVMSVRTDEDYLTQIHEAGADGCVTRPVNPKELRRRVKTFVERTRNYIQASPLTGLPGNTTVEYQIIQRIKQKDLFGVAYIDIDQFKSYNDTYSWLSGDTIIVKTAQILVRALELYGGPNSFVGHLGGDDFVAILAVDRAAAFAETVIREFDAMILMEYNQQDRERGYVIHHDRQGNLYCFPLLSLTIAIVTNESAEFVHAGQVVQIGLELKEYLKTKLGSNYLIDRRLRKPTG